jgi:type IV pilus assembly protein PilZ
MVPQRQLFSLVIKDELILHKTYMAFLKNGGLFIPCEHSLKIGEKVFLLLRLINLSEQIPIAAKVVWVTFAGATSNRAAGVGVQFEDQDSEAKIQIENILAGRLDIDAATLTM